MQDIFHYLSSFDSPSRSSRAGSRVTFTEVNASPGLLVTTIYLSNPLELCVNLQHVSDVSCKEWCHLNVMPDSTCPWFGAAPLYCVLCTAGVLGSH